MPITRRTLLKSMSVTVTPFATDTPIHINIEQSDALTESVGDTPVSTAVAHVQSAFQDNVVVKQGDLHRDQDSGGIKDTWRHYDALTESSIGEYYDSNILLTNLPQDTYLGYGDCPACHDESVKQEDNSGVIGLGQKIQTVPDSRFGSGPPHLILSMLLHEIGHTLGLGHDDGTSFTTYNFLTNVDGYEYGLSTVATPMLSTYVTKNRFVNVENNCGQTTVDNVTANIVYDTQYSDCEKRQIKKYNSFKS